MDKSEPAVESAWFLRGWRYVFTLHGHGVKVDCSDYVYSILIEGTREPFSIGIVRNGQCNVRYAIANGIKRSNLTIYTLAAKLWRTVAAPIPPEPVEYANATTLEPHPGPKCRSRHCGYRYANM